MDDITWYNPIACYFFFGTVLRENLETPSCFYTQILGFLAVLPLNILKPILQISDIIWYPLYFPYISHKFIFRIIFPWDFPIFSQQKKPNFVLSSSRQSGEFDDVPDGATRSAQNWGGAPQWKKTCSGLWGKIHVFRMVYTWKILEKSMIEQWFEDNEGYTWKHIEK